MIGFLLLCIMDLALTQGLLWLATLSELRFTITCALRVLVDMCGVIGITGRSNRILTMYIACEVVLVAASLTAMSLWIQLLHLLVQLCMLGLACTVRRSRVCSHQRIMRLAHERLTHIVMHDGCVDVRVVRLGSPRNRVRLEVMSRVWCVV